HCCNCLGSICFRCLLEILCVRHRCVSLMHTNHRRVEIVEAFTLNEVDYLRSHSADLPALFEYDCAIRFLNRLRNRLDVDRTNGPQIDDVDLDVLLCKLI